MHNLKAATAFLTLFAFIVNGPMGLYADAQTATQPLAGTAATGAATVPNYAPSSLQTALGMASNSLSNAMTACNAKGLLGAGDKSLSGALAGAISGSNKAKKADTKAAAGSGGDCAGKTKAQFTCDMTCSEPSADKSGASCDNYFKSKETGDKFSSKIWIDDNSKSGGAQLAADIKEQATYVDFITFKMNTCVGKTMEQVQAQYAVYQCQMQALSTAVQQASTQLQASLTQNGQNFQKMNQFTKQVGDQMSQIDEILGPDPTDPNAKGGAGGQFGGLLGVQKELTEQLSQWTGNEATFKTSVDQIQKDTTTNDQTLEADRMAQVTDCMKGNTNLGVSGGRSLTCYKPVTQSVKDSSGQTVSNPVTDSSGNMKYSLQACGALEYVRSQVEQAPIKKINNASHAQKSQQLTLEFDSMVNSMMRDMGSYDAATADGKLVGRTTSWSDLSKKYAADMQDLSAKTGVNVAAQMSSVATSCYNAGDSWKKQQINSSASAYNKKKTEITANTNKLNAQLTQGLSDMNKQYAGAMSILANGAAVSIDRSSCTNSDPAKMETCYSSIKGKMQDILDGSGTVGTTSKSIAGGSMVQPFSVSCKGINGCVTTYQNVRKMKKDQLKAGQKATEDFVTAGNSQIQNQLQGFAQYLGGLQGQVNAQFGAMQGLLGQLGVESDAKPNFMNPEQLQPMKGPNGEMGPFEAPKSMAGVLSGMVQPTGLMNFQDTGAQDILKAAQKKVKEDKSDLADKLKSHSSDQKKLASLSKSCDASTLADSNHAVGLTNESNCRQNYNQCTATKKIKPLSGNGIQLFAQIAKAARNLSSTDAARSTEAEKISDDLSNQEADDDCQGVLDSCMAYVTGSGKEEAYTSKDKSGVSGATLGN